MADNRYELDQELAERPAPLSGQARFGVDRDGALVYWSSTAGFGLAVPPSHIAELMVAPAADRLAHALGAAIDGAPSSDSLS